MAQKRMFDKRITDSDKFTDLPNSSKALYFMAGMSADDRGFFQPRRLQKMCGFTDDDFKVLIAKRYFISFESGVMVITDWNKNNWLDKRRISETEYIEELKLLKLINEKYELNNTCLANAKPMLRENRIEQNSIEENSINNTIIAKANDDDLKNTFEELWKLYPNKKGKADAYKKFKKLIKDGTSIETIKDGIQRYKDYIEAEHIKPQYIKYGSTFFNQESWKDDFTITRKPTTKDLADKIDFMNFLKED